MKKLTAIIPDEIDASLLTGLISVAVDLKFETITQDSKPRKARNLIPNTNTWSTIMEHFSPEAIFNKSNAQLWLKQKGYTPTSANSALQRLVRRGHIKFLGSGRYQFKTPLPKETSNGK